MNQKSIIAVLGVTVIALIGTTAYFATINQAIQPVVPAPNTEKQFTVVKDTNIESDFSVPSEWTYKKNSDEINKIIFFDKNNKQIAEMSLFSEKLDKTAETSFDDCWRQWEIYSSDTTKNTESTNKFALNHYIYKTNDGLTSTTAESCKAYVGVNHDMLGNIAFIYWVPGEKVTNQQSLNNFYGKKPVRVLKIEESNMNDDDFIQLVHSIAKSVTIKN